jgi:WD40 repeat protein
MLGLVVAGLIICLTMIFFLLNSSSKKQNTKSNNSNNSTKIKSEEKETQKEQEKEEIPQIPKKDISKYLLKTIKEGKDMKKCYFYNKGHIILFCDEKRLCLCYLKQLNSSSHKIVSKNIDKDIIVDVCFSPKKKVIFCASKNSKSIIQYNLEKIEGKIKLQKSEKIIICDRPYEIKSIVTNDLGNLISTIGTNGDTEIQIYDTISLNIKFKQSTGGIENFQMLMGPNDTDLLVSTFMNDISVINLEKNDKFNSETKQYEDIYSFKRNSSISGVKAKLLYYCLSNDEKFFAISGDDKTIKIFRNYGNISESKMFKQISLNFNAYIAAFYVEDFENGRLSGLIAVCNGSDAYVYDTNGKLILELPDAHDSDIISLYITKDNLNRKESVENEELKKDEDNKSEELCLISAGKDGRIKFWKINC